jgi:hypothetical protein
MTASCGSLTPLQAKELDSCTFAPDTQASKKSNSSSLNSSLFSKAGRRATSAGDMSLALAGQRTGSGTPPNRRATSSELNKLDYETLRNQNISAHLHANNTTSPEDSNASHRLLENHIIQLEATLAREKSRREASEKELEEYKNGTVGIPSSILPYVSNRIEQLMKINKEQYEETKSSFQSYQHRMDELELRLSRFVNALDDQTIIEETRAHITSLTVALRDSRASELKYIELNSKLIIDEGDQLLRAIQVSDNGTTAPSVNNYTSSVERAIPSEIKEEIITLQKSLEIVEEKLELYAKSSPNLYIALTAMPECKLRSGIEQALYSLKLKHEGELKMLRISIGEIEVCGYFIFFSPLTTTNQK